VLFGSHGKRYLARLTQHGDFPAGAAPVTGGGVRLLPHGTTPAIDSFDIHRTFGAASSFLVDMQGIDSFLYARAKLFRDETARQAALLLALPDAGLHYLRVGAAGAPPTPHHPGGEVLECAVLRGRDLSGISSTASGFLPTGADLSVATPLALAGATELLDGRSIYSHTAFLASRADWRSDCGTLALRLTATGPHCSALDAVTGFAEANGIDAYALRLFAQPAPGCVEPPVVVGRVLRRLPHRRLRSVEEAGAIASERAFELQPGQQLHGYGTHYRRSEPDWEAFRAGKPYEARGHIHLVIRGGVRSSQHELCHLRELYLTPQTECYALITPVRHTVRVEPVLWRDGRLLSRASGREIEVPGDFTRQSA
jgi:hypothetical protein